MIIIIDTNSFIIQVFFYLIFYNHIFLTNSQNILVNCLQKEALSIAISLGTQLEC